MNDPSVGSQLNDALSPDTDDPSTPPSFPTASPEPTPVHETADEAGSPEVPTDLLELHMALEAQGKTPADLKEG